jgi:hypothetical protein
LVLFGFISSYAQETAPVFINPTGYSYYVGYYGEPRQTEYYESSYQQQTTNIYEDKGIDIRG